MRSFFAGCLFVLGTIPAAANAANATGNYAVWGIGQASCNQFSQAYDANALKEYQTYLAGYLTAYSTFAPPSKPSASGHSLKDALKRVYDHCGTHRMDSYERGIQATLLLPAVGDTPANTPAQWGRPPTATTP